MEDAIRSPQEYLDGQESIKKERQRIAVTLSLYSEHALSN